MRSRRSQPTWTHYWLKPIRWMLNDETTCGDRYSSHDHLARPGGVMAISYCGDLHSDLARACGDSSSDRQERIQTQLRNSAPLNFALRGQHWSLRSVNLYCWQIIDR